MAYHHLRLGDENAQARLKIVREKKTSSGMSLRLLNAWPKNRGQVSRVAIAKSATASCQKRRKR